MEFQLVGSGRRGTHSPRMRNAPLTHHIPAASPATTRFLSQIAILGSSVSVYFREVSAAEDVHTEHKQKRGGGDSQIGWDLEK